MKSEACVCVCVRVQPFFLFDLAMAGLLGAAFNSLRMQLWKVRAAKTLHIQVSAHTHTHAHTHAFLVSHAHSVLCACHGQ